ncbi:hypothetical protein HWV62_27057 [Athelia sp. TMB]|nr:hypothetical protein HWV62_27057 [Athelia sp. TMB]
MSNSCGCVGLVRTRHRSGVKAKRLPRIGFVPDEPGHDAFGYINPSEIIRAVHLMPVFAYEKTKGLLGRSIARQSKGGDEDWHYYYVNIWADRDMFMRFRGIGHKALRPIEDFLDGANIESPEVSGSSENVANTPIEDPPSNEDEDEIGEESDDEREMLDEEALGPEDGEDLEENPAY